MRTRMSVPVIPLVYHERLCETGIQEARLAAAEADNINCGCKTDRTAANDQAIHGSISHLATVQVAG